MQGYDSSFSNSNQILYLTFDDVAPNAPPSTVGIRVKDHSSYGQDMMMYGGINVVPSFTYTRNRFLQFLPGVQSTQNYLKNNPTMVPRDKFTLNFWFNENSMTSHTHECIFSYAVGSHTNEFNMFKFGGSGAWRMHIHSTYVTFNDDPYRPLDTWRHISTTWVASTGALQLYIDGVLRQTLTIGASGKVPLETTNGVLVIGQDQDTLGGGFQSSQCTKSSIDELQVKMNK